MRHVAFMRHGQAESNVERKLRSTGCDALTGEGEVQAKHAAEFLRKWGVKQILSSDLKRASQTSQIISEILGLKPILRPAFRERFYGEYEGYRLSDVEEQRRLLGHTFVDPTQDWHGIISVETPDSVANRVLPEVTRYIKKDKALVVTHAGVLVSLVRWLSRGDTPRAIFKFPYCSILWLESNKTHWAIRGIIPVGEV